MGVNFSHMFKDVNYPGVYPTGVLWTLGVE